MIIAPAAGMRGRGGWGSAGETLSVFTSGMVTGQSQRKETLQVRRKIIAPAVMADQAL